MSKKYLPIIFLAGSLLLFACSSHDTTTDNNNSPMETLQEQTILIETEALPEEEVATASETPQQTEITTLATETPEEVQMDSNSLCYHPYFPIVDGASWTYDAGIEEDYTLRIEETGEDSFKMIQEMLDEDLVYTVDWYCSQDGILRGSFGQLDLINQAASEEDTPEFIFETLEWEGETLPSPELLENGYTWTSFYRLSANLELQGFSQSAETEVIIDHEIAGIDEVTVPAGTFPEAIRVDSDGQINMSLIMGESKSPISSFDFTYSTWYVEGLGMVKTISGILDYDTGVSLINSSLLD